MHRQRKIDTHARTARYRETYTFSEISRPYTRSERHLPLHIQREIDTHTDRASARSTHIHAQRETYTRIHRQRKTTHIHAATLTHAARDRHTYTDSETLTHMYTCSERQTPHTRDRHAYTLSERQTRFNHLVNLSLTNLLMRVNKPTNFCTCTCK